MKRQLRLSAWRRRRSIGLGRSGGAAADPREVSIQESCRVPVVSVRAARWSILIGIACCAGACGLLLLQCIDRGGAVGDLLSVACCLFGIEQAAGTVLLEGQRTRCCDSRWCWRILHQVKEVLKSVCPAA
uniref:Uncharacterized protein n=1 Tax=Arundo donax TaxID=35708 RepID=A0A0A9HY64_ARUDO